MSDIPIGPTRDVTGPAFDVEDERLALQRLLAERGIPHAKSRRLADYHVQHSLLADEHNGEPLWVDPVSGRLLRGMAGRYGLADRIADSERRAAFGPDPLEVAIGRCERDWGIPEAESRRLLEHRLRRLDDGSISYSPGPGEALRTGGEELIDLAVQRTVAAVQAKRATRPDATTEAEVRARHHFGV